MAASYQANATVGISPVPSSLVKDMLPPGLELARDPTDAEIDQYLNNAGAKPRQAQHALVQIGERLTRGDSGAKRWYTKIIEDAGSPALELRQSAAWIMGQDHTYAPFHDALLKLLGRDQDGRDVFILL